MSEVVIRAENLSKQYQIGVLRSRHPTLGDFVGDSLRSLLKWRAGIQSGVSTIWALKDASFEIKRGEAVGVIGRNGAGKSTLLKMLARVVVPTEGRAEIHGRAGSILEVGTGFHPELTGRENIYLSGAILGMRKREVDRKFDEIVAFSEIEQFLETPVKRYSSGMYVRMAFAVAAHLETDVLLVDEVLAVGDVEFQAKCMSKMAATVADGRTIFFVSHNLAAVQSLCPRGLLVRQGRIAVDGTVEEAVQEYLAYLSAGSATAFTENRERSGNGKVRLTSARVLTESNEPTSNLVAGDTAVFEFTYENPTGAKSCRLAFSIVNQMGVAATNCDTTIGNGSPPELAGAGTFRCVIPKIPLPIGQYRVAVVLESEGHPSDTVPNALVFNVESSTFFPSGRSPHMRSGSCLVMHHWDHEVSPDGGEDHGKVSREQGRS